MKGVKWVLVLIPFIEFYSHKPDLSDVVGLAGEDYEKTAKAVMVIDDVTRGIIYRICDYEQCYHESGNALVKYDNPELYDFWKKVGTYFQ